MNDNANGKKDIFDKIMSLSCLRAFLPFYVKYKEGLIYLFFGFLSFLISFITYAIFTEILFIEELIANIFAWIFSVSFAYITNRTWVFKTKAYDFGGIIKEIGRFLSGRVATLIAEEVMIFIFIDYLDFPNLPVKLAASFVVIILNYLISKFWVFKKDNYEVKKERDKQ